MINKKKIIVILFNLGGPSSLQNVRKFLFNLFYDKAILPLPNPFRWILANIIAIYREKKSISIYEKIGGRSPILEQTQKQAESLEKILNNDYDAKILISMRCSHPFSYEIMDQIIEYNPEEIILLPLYPHFSITTSKSSIDDFLRFLPKKIAHIKKKIICCYPTEENFIKSHKILLENVTKNLKNSNYKLIISAHGLPKNVIEKGDPYIWQIEQTCTELTKFFPNINWELSYQSRVGPVEWTGPNTEDVIKESAKKFDEIILLPISFVSEHSETLVELDIDYKNMAEKLGIRNFYRIETLQIENNFLESLRNLCISILSINQKNNIGIYSQNIDRICPKEFCKCINNGENIG